MSQIYQIISYLLKFFLKKFFKKIELRNKRSNELINKDIKYSSDIEEFLQYWKYDKDDFQNLIERRNQELCNVVERRLKKDETNTRLHERLGSVEKTKWNVLDKFDIPLSMIHQLFKTVKKCGYQIM